VTPSVTSRQSDGGPAADADLLPLASELRIVVGRMIRRLRTQYRFGLTQIAVLGRLDREGQLSTGELAKGERVRPQSMSQTLGELEAEGLVARTQDENDGRRTLVALTDAGRQAIELDRASRDGWLARALAEELSAEERHLLQRALGLLGRITEHQA
jgi:DNA-binding MarR family transcriptional regulator